MTNPPSPTSDGVVRLAIRGDWTLEVVGPDGRVKATHRKQNTVVNDGLDWIRAYAFLGWNPSEQPDPMGYIAVGTGSTPVSNTDTALVTELSRQAVDTYVEGGTGVVTLSTTFDGGGTSPISGTITEAGLFNDLAAGTMFARVVFTGVAKEESDSLKISSTFTFTAAS